MSSSSLDAARDLPRDQSVFLNHTATFTFCTSLLPVSYTINGLRSDLLDNNLKDKIKFTYNGSCYSLSFPAWMDYDGASIRFHYNQTSNSRTATLHVQGVLCTCVYVCMCAYIHVSLCIYTHAICISACLHVNHYVMCECAPFRHPGSSNEPAFCGSELHSYLSCLEQSSISAGSREHLL